MCNCMLLSRVNDRQQASHALNTEDSLAHPSGCTHLADLQNTKLERAVEHLENF